jgi:hypothetical protein
MRGRYLTPKALAELEAQLSQRDWLVIQTVSGLRFVSGDQLRRLGFADASARATRRALLRLTDLGVLERLPRQVGGVRAGSAGFVYRLAAAGQRLAASRGEQPPRRKSGQVPGMRFVAHALQSAELATLLVEADRAGQLELLELVNEPACWRRWSQGRLRPDGFLRIGAGDFEDSYFIEVDMGTVGSQALSAKLRQYLAYAASGSEQAEHGVFPKVLWLTPDQRRAAVIQALVKRLPCSAWELFEAVPFAEALDRLAAGEGLSGRETIFSKEYLS